jgi:hypothetical protein
MAKESRGKVERLRAAGIIIVDPLPDVYAEILEADLDDGQVGVIISVIEKLIAAEKRYGSEAEAEARPLVQCFVPL